MDFQLTYNRHTGGPDMTFDKATDLLNNIILSLAIVKGSWWHDRNFGMTRRDRLKATPASIRLVRQDAEQALQWIIDAGRATRIDVSAVRDYNNRHRVNLLVQAYQADGRIITYNTFKEVF